MSQDQIVHLFGNIILKVHNENGKRIIGKFYKQSEDKCSNKTTFLCTNTVLLKDFENCSPNKVVYFLKLLKLYDAGTLRRNVYLVLDYGVEQEIFIVNYCKSDLSLKSILSTKCFETEVYVCDGPAFISLNNDNLVVKTPWYEVKSQFKVVKNSKITISSNIGQCDDDFIVQCYAFVCNNLDRMALQLKVMKHNCQILKITDCMVPHLYFEILTHIQIFSADQVPFLKLKNPSEVFIICTENKQCLIFVNGSLVAYHTIPSMLVDNIMACESSLNSDFDFLLVTKDSIALAFKFDNSCSKLQIVNSWQDFRAFLYLDCMFPINSASNLLLLKENDSDSTIYAIQPFLPPQNDVIQSESNHISSAVSTIQSKILNMQLLENELNEEINEKNRVNAMIESQITKCFCASNGTDTNNMLVKLFNDEPGNSLQEIPALDIRVDKDSWRIIHTQKSILYGRITIYNVTKNCIDDICISCCTKDTSSTIDVRFIKCKVPQSKNQAKHQKFDDVPSSLQPLQRAIIGLKIPTNIFEIASLMFILHLSWKSKDKAQQSNTEIIIDLCKIGDLSISNNTELFLSDLNVLNAFMFKLTVQLESFYTDLQNLAKILTDLKEFSFKLFELDNILFTEKNIFVNGCFLISMKILNKSSQKADLRIYTCSEQNDVFFISKLLSCHGFPKDINIIRSSQSFDKIKHPLLINLKSELSHFCSFFKNKVPSVDSIDEHDNLGHVDNERNLFSKKLQIINEDIKINSDDCEVLNSCNQKLRKVTDDFIMKINT